MQSTPFLARALAFFLLLGCTMPLYSQDTLPEHKHAAIIFPYPMTTERWRASLGFTLLSTPEDITEEVQIRVPAIDFHVLRKISPQFIAEGRIMAQVLQNQLIAGVHWVKPISNRLFFSVGNDVGYWFGFLNLEGFNSHGSGWFDYPVVRLGIKTPKNLLITLRAQTSFNLHYSASNGKATVSKGTVFYNGETFSIALEQPFFHHSHLTLAFSAIYNYFYWQTWPLFYQVNRKIFYPQTTVGFIL